jgi:3-oxoadipate enol-lactonase
LFADIDGNTMQYVSYGEGPPVVFVHGLGGSANVWHGVMQAMQQHHHVIAMDLRGHGRSQGRGQFSIEGWAKDVTKLIRHLELPSVTLVGHSLGTLVVQHLAEKEPELCDQLVLVGGISYFQPPTADAYRERADLVAEKGMDVLVDAWLEGAVSPQTHATSSATVGLLRELFLRNEPANYAKSCKALAVRAAGPTGRDRAADPDRHRGARPLDPARDGRGAALLDPGQPRQGAAGRRATGSPSRPPAPRRHHPRVPDVTPGRARRGDALRLPLLADGEVVGAHPSRGAPVLDLPRRRLDLGSRVGGHGHRQPHPGLVLRPRGHLRARHGGRHARRLVAEGADIVDVGGVKGGPGDRGDGRRGDRPDRAVRHGPPRGRAGRPVSVDTFRAPVADAALAAGADIVNDVTGLHDPEVLDVVVARDAGYVAMHHGGEPRTRPYRRSYTPDVTTAVVRHCAALTERAVAAGVPPVG